MQVLKELKMNCPACKGKAKIEDTTMNLFDGLIKVKDKTYKCKNCGLEFSTSKMVDESVKRVKAFLKERSKKALKAETRCVIFDFGDTLAQSSKAGEQAGKQAFEREILQKKGFKFSKKQIFQARKRMHEKTKNLPTKTRMNDKLIYARTVLEELGLKPSKKLAEKLEKEYYKKLLEKLKPMPNAIKTLEFLKNKGLILCVVSNTRHSFNLKAAKKFKLRKYFKHFIMSHEFGSVKSELKIFQHLLEKLNKNRKNKILPQECLMVGNHAGEDGAAKLIGMKVALLKPTLVGKQHLKSLKPDYWLNDLSGVKKITKS